MEVTYVFWKTTGSGPDVVFLHGLGATHFSWGETVGQLRNDFTCHEVDLPGFGASWPPPPSYAHTLKEQASIVIEHLDQKKIDEALLVGHSMGGGVCTHITRMCKEAGSSHRIAAMALVAPALVPPCLDPFDLNRFKSSDSDQGIGTASGSISDAIGVRIARGILAEIYHDDKKVPLVDEYAKAYGVNFSWDRWESFGRHITAMGLTSNYNLDFSAIDCPVRIIWGKHDTVVSSEYGGSPIADAFGNASAIEIEDCGHVPHEERPDFVIDEIKSFLNSV